MWMSCLEIKVPDKKDTIEICHVCAGTPMQLKQMKKAIVRFINLTTLEEVKELFDEAQK